MRVELREEGLGEEGLGGKRGLRLSSRSRLQRYCCRLEITDNGGLMAWAWYGLGSSVLLTLSLPSLFAFG